MWVVYDAPSQGYYMTIADEVHAQVSDISSFEWHHLESCQAPPKNHALMLKVSNLKDYWRSCDLLYVPRNSRYMGKDISDIYHFVGPCIHETPIQFGRNYIFNLSLPGQVSNTFRENRSILSRCKIVYENSKGAWEECLWAGSNMKEGLRSMQFNKYYNNKQRRPLTVGDMDSPSSVLFPHAPYSVTLSLRTIDRDKPFIRELSRICSINELNSGVIVFWVVFGVGRPRKDCQPCQ